MIDDNEPTKAPPPPIYQVTTKDSATFVGEMVDVGFHSIVLAHATSSGLGYRYQTRITIEWWVIQNIVRISE